MPDGGVIVSYDAAQGPNFERFDSSGNSVKAFTVKTRNGIPTYNVALDPDGATFWTTDLNYVYRVSLSDGSLVETPAPNGGSEIGGVSVYGGFEAASGPSDQSAKVLAVALGLDTA